MSGDVRVWRGGVQAATLENVLFGDVYLCGGQSNMAMNLRVSNNGSQLIAAAAAYSRIRVLTVGQRTGVPGTGRPLPQLGTIDRGARGSSAQDHAAARSPAQQHAAARLRDAPLGRTSCQRLRLRACACCALRLRGVPAPMG